MKEIVMDILTRNSIVDLSLEETDQNRTSLDLYQTTFEDVFLRNTMEFYQEDSRNFLMHHSVIEYLRWAEHIFNREQKRVDTYLHDSTRSKVRTSFRIR